MDALFAAARDELARRLIRAGVLAGDTGDVIQVAWISANRRPPPTVTGTVLFRLGRTKRGRPASVLAGVYLSYLARRYRDRERRQALEAAAAMVEGGAS